EIFVDLDREAGYLDRLALGCGDRRLLALELALRQHPGVVLATLDQRNQRALPVSHHNTARSHDRRPRHAAPHSRRLKHELTSLWRATCKPDVACARSRLRLRLRDFLGKRASEGARP